MIEFSRVGGMRPPRFRELLGVEPGGAFTLWRSVSHASALPAPIGRFAGAVPDEALAALRSAAAAALAAGSRTWPILPDSPVDTIRLGGAEAMLGIHEAGDGDWADLIGALRALLADLTAFPQAAVDLAVDPGKDGGARLVHRGPDPLKVDLADLAIRVVHWRDSQSQGMWSGQLAGPVATVAPGWQLDLPFDHGFHLAPADRLSVQVLFAAQDGDDLVPVSLQNA